MKLNTLGATNMKMNHKLKTGKDMTAGYKMKDKKYEGGEPLTDGLKSMTKNNTVAKSWAKY